MQSYGLELMEVFDALRERGDRERWRADHLRLAYVTRANGVEDIRELFPDWFPPDEVTAGSEEHEAALAAGAKEDYSGVRWMSPGDAGFASMEDEWAAIQAQLAEQDIEINEGDSVGGEWV